MATVAAVIASTHHPFYFRASTSPPETRPPFADEWVAKIMAFRETLSRARPDVLVMVGSDHFHQLWLDNMPQFLIGSMLVFDGTFYNETREFGIPTFTIPGDPELAGQLRRPGPSGRVPEQRPRGREACHPAASRARHSPAACPRS